ncbi:TPA: hypothetical protein ACSC58_005424 [Bacillus paranthracis]
MFVNKRVYYDVKTGNVIQITGDYNDTGLYHKPSVDDDVLSYTALRDRVRDTFDVIELERNQFADEFSKAISVRVDLKTKQLVFEFKPSDQEELEQQKTLEKRVSMLEGTVNDILMGGM